jgi:hypothetical protein
MPDRDSDAARIHYRGPWRIAYKATDVLCSDGKRRTARITGEADTFFTLPASVSVSGKTVSGFLMQEPFEHEDESVVDVLTFTAYRKRKNGQLLPEWLPIPDGQVYRSFSGKD